MEGEMGVAGGTVHYAGSVNLCQVCDYLYEKDIFFRLEVSTQAVRHISGVS